MYTKLIRNDIRKSKLITSAITAFILIAALLLALAASLTVNLASSVENMLTSAKALHFLQMHTGSVDEASVAAFAGASGDVEEYQIQPFLNIEAADILIGGETLGWSIQDNGFTTQSTKFDFLLNMQNEVISPSEGELYVPVYYLREGAVKVGDTANIHGVSLTVAGFLRDSAMNPALASSKRFLVNEADYAKLIPFGQLETLISFRLKDGVVATDFEAAYLSAGMPSNGPPVVTYALVQLMNGMTDGIMIAVLALIGILVIIVAFLCIRFTLLAKIEDDYREIGVLKAVGMRVSSIKKLYTVKYGFLAGIACLLGFFLSLPLNGLFMENIKIFMGESGRTAALLGCVFSLVGAALIYGAVMLYVNVILQRFRKISAAQAIRFGAPNEKAKSTKSFQLNNNRLLSRNVFLGMKDVLMRKKLYVTMLCVLIISSFILIVPQNIYNTISARSFITYMGMGICDFSIFIMRSQEGDIAQKAQEAIKALEADANIENIAVNTAVMFDMTAANGTPQRLRVTLGDHTTFPITYSQGRAPQTPDEIALSVLNADDLGKTVGDTIMLTVNGVKTQLSVCGVYSDLTNGGRTAKAVFTADGDVLSMIIAANFRAGTDAAAEIARYKEQFPLTKVYSIGDLRAQTLGSMTNAVSLASRAAIGVTALLTILVTLLFMKMLVAKDKGPIAVLKSLGFTSAAIMKQYMTRSAAVLVVGVVVGTILANTLGEYVGAALISSFGASSFNFVVNPLFAYVFAPLLVAACVFGATALGVSDIRPLKISDHIKE